MRTAAALTLLTLAGCTQSASPPRGRPADLSPPPTAEPVPLAQAVISAEPWEYEGVRGQVVRTANYRLYMTESDALLAGRLPGFLELALEHYRTAITPLPAPDLRLDAYLMDNRPQWARLTQRLLGNRAAPFLRIQRGGFATRGIGVYYDIGAFDTLSIAAHEGWHQYTQRVFRERLPLWLEEGLATYMEGHRWVGATPVFLPWANLERFDHLRSLTADGRERGLSAFLVGTGALGEDERTGLDFYAQAWAVTHFLVERRRAGLARLLDDAASGRLTRTVRAHVRRGAAAAPVRTAEDFQRALFEAYFGGLDAADGEFGGFLRGLTAPGSRGEVTAGRMPSALRGVTTND